MQYIIFQEKKYTYEQFASSITKKNISIDDIKKSLTYELFEEFGHYILATYDSYIFDPIKFEIIEKYIKKTSEKEIIKNMSHYILKNHKKTLVEIFGDEVYNKFWNIYL
jgi:hypothetical protein